MEDVSGGTTPPAAWTREDLVELVRGKTVTIRDIAGRSRPLPSWMAEVATAGDAVRWEVDVVNVHPTDRVAMIQRWWACLDKPGTLLSTTYRFREDDGIHIYANDYLNLLEDDELGVLSMSIDLGVDLTEEDWDAAGPAFEFEPTDWVIFYMTELADLTVALGRTDAIFGRRLDDAVGASSLDLIHERHHAALTAVWLDLLLEPNGSRSIRMEAVRPDRSTVWIEATLHNGLNDERIGRIVATIHDITATMEHEAAERAHTEALRRGHEELQVLAEQVPAAVFRADRSGSITFSNRRLEELAASSANAEDAIESLYDIVDPEDRPAVTEMLETLASPVRADAATIEVRGTGGRVYSLACRLVGAVDDHAPPVIIGSISDITEKAGLQHEATHDTLTGLLNRRAIIDRLDRAIGAHEGENEREDDGDADGAQVLVAFIDLDGFKAVNDQNDHAVGDLVLREIGDRLRHAMRPSDAIGRLGGDEFVVLFDGPEALIAERIDSVLAEPIVWDGGAWEPAASVGFAQHEPGETAAELLRRADHEMYRRKLARRGDRSAPR